MSRSSPITCTYHGLSVDGPELSAPKSIWLPLAPEELDNPDDAAKSLWRELMAEQLENGLPGPAPLVETAEALSTALDGVDITKQDGDAVHWFLVVWE